MARDRRLARGDGHAMNDRTFERIESLFDIGLFRDVNVLIAGCGSGGGSVALHLVMSGIRNFTLIDKDTVGVENVIRHVCGRRYIGWKKVDAVGDVLLDRNPKANIAKIAADIMNCPNLDAEIAKADVVVLATDNEPTRYMVNDLCVRTRTPFVVGRVFTRGIGGEAFAYRPPDGACLACLEAGLERTPFRQGIREIELVSEEEREKVYGMEIAEIKDSPGLAVDIAFITSFHARYVLDAIARRLPERPKYLDPIDENYVIWGNRRVHPFTRSFHLQRIAVSARSDCAVCATRGVAHAV
jgi:molybdopterin-synthase adenylyltransferase